MKTTPFIVPALGLAAILFTGCETTAPVVSEPEPVYMETAYNSEEFEPYLEEGTARVHGQAFLKTRGGDVKVGAGEWVSLIPATDFMVEATTWFQRGVEPVNYTPLREDLEQYIRRTVADAEGNFEFTDVPAGKYILQVKITWEVPGVYGYMSQTGGMVFRTVDVEDGANSRVMLTR